MESPTAIKATVGDEKNTLLTKCTDAHPRDGQDQHTERTASWPRQICYVAKALRDEPWNSQGNKVTTTQAPAQCVTSNGTTC